MHGITLQEVSNSQVYNKPSSTIPLIDSTEGQGEFLKNLSVNLLNLQVIVQHYTYCITVYIQQ